jgi:hypothetical protein
LQLLLFAYQQLSDDIFTGLAVTVSVPDLLEEAVAGITSLICQTEKQLLDLNYYSHSIAFLPMSNMAIYNQLFPFVLHLNGLVAFNGA